jgi:hypothetical protein
VLRDDFYIGVVTLNGIKRPGGHDPLIEEDTFERVQQLLDAHRASWRPQPEHQHYLSGTLYCTCGHRMGYGRHRSKSGRHYEYFSCLISRVSRRGPCGAAYAPVEAVERAVEAEYQTDRASLSETERKLVRATVKAFVDAKAQTAVKESQRHARRLLELTDQQRKLVQLYYRDAIFEEVPRAEQERIAQERALARKWSEAAAADVKEVVEALEEALAPARSAQGSLRPGEAESAAADQPGDLYPHLHPRPRPRRLRAGRALQDPDRPNPTSLQGGEGPGGRPERVPKRIRPDFSRPEFARRSNGGEVGTTFEPDTSYMRVLQRALEAAGWELVPGVLRRPTPATPCSSSWT